MELRFITQPRDSQGNLSNLGSVIEQLLRSRAPFFKEAWFVSSFANHLGVVRLREAIRKAISDGAITHFIVGIDFRQTSIESLREILSFTADCKIVKNVNPYYTFHPKIYLFEAPNQQAKLILGSSNLTDGGMYRNFEVNIQISYDISNDDKSLYAETKRSLDPFLNPYGPLTQILTGDLLETLINRGDVISEHQKRQNQVILMKSTTPKAKLPPSPFGAEYVPTPPLPPDYLSDLIRTRERTGMRTKTTRGTTAEVITDKIPTASAFYMHLPKLQGPNIPGETRIPLAARDIAQNFWGWPDHYTERVIHEGKKPRHYMEWKPRWRILDVDNPSKDYLVMVRMYEYKESKDFRFYSRNLVTLGADKMDTIRITKPEDKGYEFQCELAKRGSPTHSKWEPYCTQRITNSSRRFGYAS